MENPRRGERKSLRTSILGVERVSTRKAPIPTPVPAPSQRFAGQIALAGLASGRRNCQVSFLRVVWEDGMEHSIET